MLHQRVQDTSNTERRLDDVGYELSECDISLLLLELDNFLVELDFATCNAFDGELDLAVLLHADGQLLTQFLRQLIEGRLDSLGILLELGARLLLIQDWDPLFDDVGFLELLACSQWLASGLLVHRQIISRAVGTSDTLGPAVRVENLAVPAVRGVVGHFVLQVLSEADLRHVHANLLHELVDSDEEVSKSLVVNKLCCDSFTNCNHLGLSTSGGLGSTAEEWKLDVCHAGELGVLLAALRVDKVLNFTHEELSHTQKTGTRRKLVAERVAKRGRGEWELAITELKELLEREELTLSGFWAEESRGVASGTDLGLEHEIDRDWGLNFVVGGWVADVVLLDQLAHGITSEVVEDGKNVDVLITNCVVQFDGGFGKLGSLLLLLGVFFTSLNLLSTSLLVRIKTGLQNILDKMVCSQNLTTLRILAYVTLTLYH